METFRAPWQHENLFPPRQLKDGRYGVLVDGRVAEMSLPSIVQALHTELREEKPSFVVGLVETPEEPRLVSRFSIPALQDVVAAHMAEELPRQFRKNLWISLGLLPLLLLSAWLAKGPVWFLWFYFFPAAQEAVALGLLRRRLNQNPARVFAILDAQFRFEYWVARFPTVGLWRTWSVAALWVALFISQLVIGMAVSVDRAGLVKPLVREGEGWRLLSAALLHGGVMHVVFNGFSWISLAPTLERVLNPRVLLPVFVLSVLGGSLFSVVLLAAPSVGASGGILGLLGLLSAMAIRRRDLLPPGYWQGLVPGILSLVVMGILGWTFIDNAAHAGGFLTGLILGLLLLRAPNGPLPLPTTRAWIAADLLALGALLTTAVWVGWRFWTAST